MSPRRPRGPDPEQQRRQAHAIELMLAVAARLLGEARLAREFPTEDGALAAFVERFTPELRADEHLLLDREDWIELPRSDYKVLIGEPAADAVGLSCHYGSHSQFGRLRIDGVLDEQGGGFGLSVDDPEQRIELSPEQQEVMKRAVARRREALDPKRDAFRGDEFLRAIAVEPQPGAAAQVLAVELYGDGVLVRYTYDDPVDVWTPVPLEYYELAEVEPPLEDLLAEAKEAGGNLEPNVSLSDDLGTRYVVARRGRGGVQVSFGETGFAPAVPAAVMHLTISSYAGSVTVEL